jgi:alkanesulfonate monooxygenase SsuD/methylene tetrahydromethanopterin reductase-like flavin-dependent oxidoreductase (luciferase family)
MSEIRLGVTLPQFTGDAGVFFDGVHRAENVGLDSAWVFDHLWPLSGGKERPIIEGWTALSSLAAATETIGIGTLVTRSSLRHPAVLAKMAATVGAIAPGRLTIAIGSGDHLSRSENEAFGIPYYAADRRIGQLSSTVSVVARYLRNGPVSVEDDYVSIRDLPPSPEPSQGPLIWVAGRSDDALAVAAEWGDGWNGWGGSADRFAQDSQRVLEMASARGRNVELTWANTIFLGRDDDSAHEKLGERDPGKFVVGGPETVARALLRYVESGARHLVASFPDAQNPEVYEQFAGAVREAIERG